MNRAVVAVVTTPTTTRRVHTTAVADVVAPRHVPCWRSCVSCRLLSLVGVALLVRLLLLPLLVRLLLLRLLPLGRL